MRRHGSQVVDATDTNDLRLEMQRVVADREEHSKRDTVSATGLTTSYHAVIVTRLKTTALFGSEYAEAPCCLNPDAE